MKPPKFEIHVNRELCDKAGRPQKFYSEKDYTAVMKKASVEPYRPDTIKKHEPKAYQRSDWAREMHKDIKERRGRPPGDRFIQELEKRGINQKRYEEARRLAQKGG